MLFFFTRTGALGLYFGSLGRSWARFYSLGRAFSRSDKLVRTSFRFSRALSLVRLTSPVYNFHPVKCHNMKIRNQQKSGLRLHIWNSRFTKRDAPLLGKILRNDIAGGHIGDDKVLTVGRLIRLTPYLQQLDLSRNHIGDQGAQELASALQTEGTILKRLVLDWNRIVPGRTFFCKNK